MEPCPNCDRLDCPLAAGGRAEADYRTCLEFTAGRAREANVAVRKAGQRGEFAAVYTWMDEHRDQIVKHLADANGRFEIEIEVLKSRLAAAEGEAERGLQAMIDLGGLLADTRAELVVAVGERDQALAAGADEHRGAAEIARSLASTEKLLKCAEEQLADPYRIQIDESDRQMILMSLADETFKFPGFGYAIGLIADKFHGRQMLENFRKLRDSEAKSVDAAEVSEPQEKEVTDLLLADELTCWLIWMMDATGGVTLIAVDLTEKARDRHLESVKHWPLAPDEPARRVHVEESRVNHLYGDGLQSGIGQRLVIKKMGTSLTGDAA